MENFSEAAERNKQFIAQQLVPYLRKDTTIFEIGSGSGQHALYFDQQFGPLQWQCTEMLDLLDCLRSNLHSSRLIEPIEFDVTGSDLPEPVDLIYTANTLHIMPFTAVEALFSKLAKMLKSDGHFIVYGPFKYQGEYTSESNREFDLWLQAREGTQGIRDLDQLLSLGYQSGLALSEDISMPANNQLLVWCKNQLSPLP